jgi:hypothetical protein
MLLSQSDLTKIHSHHSIGRPQLPQKLDNFLNADLKTVDRAVLDLNPLSTHSLLFETTIDSPRALHKSDSVCTEVFLLGFALLFGIEGLHKKPTREKIRPFLVAQFSYCSFNYSEHRPSKHICANSKGDI